MATAGHYINYVFSTSLPKEIIRWCSFEDAIHFQTYTYKILYKNIRPKEFFNVYIRMKNVYCL